MKTTKLFLVFFSLLLTPSALAGRDSRERDNRQRNDGGRDNGGNDGDRDNGRNGGDRDNRNNRGGNNGDNIFDGRRDFPLNAIRSIDGTNQNSNGGSAETPYLRVAVADYPGDGTGETMKLPPEVPNARTISNACSAQSSDIVNQHGLTDFVWAWGQFLDHDIDLTGIDHSSGVAPIPIIDAADPMGPRDMPFDRSSFVPGTGTNGIPRQQINLVTSFIDASNVYGSDTFRSSSLRSFEGGRLKTTKINGHELLPFNTEGLDNEGGSENTGLFVAGDVRANEHVGLIAIHTLFVREHNRLAERIADLHRDADDERIFQLAREIVGAEMQAITYKEFLPTILGPMAPSLEAYRGFDPGVDPRTTTEFSTCAFRFGHSMLSPDLMLADRNGQTGSIPLQNAFFNIDFIKNNPSNVDMLIGGLTRQALQTIDGFIIDDMRNFLFGPPGAGGLDIATLNIQRGRDHGVPGYNDVREAFGLSRVATFADVTSDTVVQERLASVYSSPDDIDPWLGGLVEDHVSGAMVGELVGTILLEQFNRLLHGDPFFYLNDRDFSSRDMNDIISIDSLKLSDIVRLNTNVDNVSGNLFVA